MQDICPAESSWTSNFYIALANFFKKPVLKYVNAFQKKDRKQVKVKQVFLFEKLLFHLFLKDPKYIC